MRWLSDSRWILATVSGGVLTLLGAASLIVSASLYYATVSIDAESRESQTDVVRAALNGIADHIATTMKALSVADDVHATVMDGGQSEFWNTTFRQRALDLVSFATMIVTDHSGSPIVSLAGSREAADPVIDGVLDILSDGAKVLKALGEGKDDVPGTRVEALAGFDAVTRFRSLHRFAIWEGHPVQINMTTIHPENRQTLAAGPAPHLVMIRRLDGSVLDRLRALTGLEDLKWYTADALPDDLALLEIEGRSGRIIGALGWQPATPGYGVIDQARPGLLAAIGLLLLVAAAVILGSALAARRLALAKSRSEVLATTDFLTGLANRHQFNLRLDTLFAASQSGGAGFYLFMVDLDKFKPLNDTHGHAAGDTALIEIADRLRAIAGESALAARIGGDEFAVIAWDMDAAAADRMAQAIVATAAEPIALGDEVLAQLGASVGYAGLPEDAGTIADLCLHADIALYHAKSKGRGASFRFERFMADGEGQAIEIANALRGVVSAGRENGAMDALANRPA